MAGIDSEHVQGLVDECVHCGFCLPACPTYSLWGQEMDSPRGRIHIMGQVLAGQPMPGAAAKHFDSCLSCMACVPACPSGVRYGEIVEAARVEIERTVRRPGLERLYRALIFGLFPYPGRLRAARLPLALAQATGLRSLLRRPAIAARTPQFLRTMESLAPPVSPIEALPLRTPAVGARRGVVGLLTGCVQSVFFSHINTATVRVLAAEGFDVVVPEAQGCCGALSSHAGRHGQAVKLAKKTIDTFRAADVDYVVVNAAGCGSVVKEYSRLLADDSSYRDGAAWLSGQARDFSELLGAYGSRALRHRMDVRVAYHDACHLGHAQGIRVQPRALLQEVPGLELVEISDQFCCGSAGIYNLVQPQTAEELGDRKAKSILASGAEMIVTTNPGCMTQIRSALERADSPIAIVHIAELLDAAIKG